MVAKPLSERISAAEQKLKQQQARLARLKAKQGTAERKLDTRRKIIVGAAVLAHAELHSATRAALQSVLRIAVTRDQDKAAIKDLLSDEWLTEGLES